MTENARYGVVVPAPKGYVSEKRRIGRSPARQPRQEGVSLGRLLAKSGVKANMFRAA